MHPALVPGEETEYAAVETPTATVAQQPGTTCIEVLLRRENGRTADEPAQGCAP